MMADDLPRSSPSPVLPDRGETRTRRPQLLLRRFLRARQGGTAIEFALLVLPFLTVIFASIETFVAFTGEQLLANATETMARRIRTGEVMTKAQFRQQFCNEISVMMPCSAAELSTPSKLYLDVRSFTSFADIPVAVPRKTSASSSDLDTSGFAYAPGGAGTINVVRAYYRWTVITDLVRPYVTNLRPAGSSMPSDFLMVSTTTFRNEQF